MTPAIVQQRKRVADAEAQVTRALAALNAPYSGREGSFRRFAEVADRHESMVDAEATFLREQAKLIEMESTP